jgi:hypothetical protein
MQQFVVDKPKALKKWHPILEFLKVKVDEKREWMAEYAEMHQLHINENVAYATLNMNGQGSILAPTVGTIPSSVWQGGAGQIGSGDVAQNLLPVSMKIAAQTIGLDLVAVKPTASPRIELLFVDFKYDNAYGDGLREDQDPMSRPLVFKLQGAATSLTTTVSNDLKIQMTAFSITERVGGISQRTWVFIGNDNTLGGSAGTLYTGPGAGSKQNWLEFLGFSRIDGLPMFRCYRQAGFTVGPLVPQDGSPSWSQKNNTFDQTTAMTITLASGFTYCNVSGTTITPNYSYTGVISSGTTLPSITLISLLEDDLPGFSQGWNDAENAWATGGTDNYKSYGSGPMNRYQDEKTYPGIIGPDVFTKVVTVGDIEISSALKRTQIEDIKASTGMDIVQKLEGVLINELTQVISKEIVAKIRSLGAKNRISNTCPKNSDGTSKFDFNVDNYLYGNSANIPGGETTHTIQRKLVAKINNASNFIATDGRIGPAQYLVTNGNIASVLQDIAGYILNPTNVGKLNTNGQLYPMGNIGNISIYVDPYQRWDDNQIYVGRKNTIDQPGLVFIPYLMAQSISLISESTFAPRMLIRSRYAVSDIGFFPEKQFMTIKVTDTHGYLI